MSKELLPIITITIKTIDEEIIFGVLSMHPNASFALTHRPHTTKSTYEIYPETINESKELADTLQASCLRLFQSGALTALPEIKVFAIDNKNWQESWKESFTLTRISPRLIIRPEWIAYTQKPYEKQIIIDPGLAFGTGMHPTTQYCLEKIDYYAATKNSFLDLGCGSGILSIGAALLKYDTILAVDNDPVAIEVSEKNAVMNKVSQLITFRTTPLQDLNSSDTFDVVGANITAPTLIAYKEKILSLVNQRGILILAGILTSQAQRVFAAYSNFPLKHIDTTEKQEWTSFCFRR